MSVHLQADGTVKLSGRCLIEDAELLRKHLSVAPGSTVEWAGCEYLHSAVVQVLMAARPRLRGTPGSQFLRARIAPLLGRSIE